MTEDKAQDSAPPADPAPVVAEKKGNSGLSNALGILGFVAALGGGFYLGKWITAPDAPEVALEKGQRVRVDLRGDEPQLGPDDALVTIVEFGDFECPYCAEGSRGLHDALESHEDDVRLIFKHYPLPFHSRAIPAARAAWAAHQFDKFWEMAPWLYEHRGDLADLAGEVTSLGMDPDAFSEKMLSREASEAVDADMMAGGKAGVSGTPAYVVNGHVYAGRMSADQWEQLIEGEAEAAQALVDSGTPREKVYETLMKDAKEVLGDGHPVGGKPSARAPERRPGEADPSATYQVTTDGRPALGPEDALVTIVEFSDFQCPFCRRLAPVSHEVVKNNPDVRVVFRQMPLPNHPRARPAAKAALAAHRQGKFWEMHDKIFGTERFGPADLERFAADLGLDVEKFKTDMQDPAIEKMIDEDMAMARRFGVLATPTAFVNGRYVRGAQTARSLQTVIDQARKKAEALVGQGVAPADVYATIMKDAETSVSAG